ncbi:MAG: hypothetical protein KF749_12505 [Bacteroidetes bacterium]|nr:hypothetical protein [Bacteroidota bacterium]MCW5897090.1 hypothetical protein [Bacteroidota bacterium]
MVNALFALLLLIPPAQGVGEGQENVDTLEVYSPTIGFLKVHTSVADRYDDGMWRREFASYRIYTTNGAMVRRVLSSLDEPRTIRLEEGTYVIREEGGKRRTPEYKVLIEGGKTTEVVK